MVPTPITITPCVQHDTWRNGYRRWLQASNNTGILNTCTRLWLTESEQATSVVSIKDVVRSTVKVPEFEKYLKKAGGHISRNVVEITIKMETIVWKPLMIKFRDPMYLWMIDSSLFFSISMCIDSVFLPNTDLFYLLLIRIKIQWFINRICLIFHLASYA